MEEADELRESRARLAVAAGGDRRRVERALHDGVLQDLIALSVKMQLLREQLRTDAVGALGLLDELQQETHRALERVQALAAEIYPPMLDARGLAEALRQAATPDRLVEVADVGRRPPEIERAVYFACRAVLEDAETGSELTLRLREREGVLLLDIAGASGPSLRAAQDLLEAAGCAVDARPTCLRASV